MSAQKKVTVVAKMPIVSTLMAHTVVFVNQAFLVVVLTAAILMSAMMTN